jgi:hypothetical protein
MTRYWMDRQSRAAWRDTTLKKGCHSAAQVSAAGWRSL